MRDLLNVREGFCPPALRGPLVATRFYCGGGGGGSSSSQSQDSSTNDSRVALQGDNAIVVKDADGVNITGLGLEATQAALDAAAELGATAGETAVGLATDAQETARELGAAALDTAAQLNSTAGELGSAALDAAQEVAAAGLATAEKVNRAGLDQLETYVTGQNEFTRQSLDLVRNQGQTALETANNLAAGSNRIAEAVAKSQEQFVATASGQKTGTTVAIGALVVGAAALLLANGKKA